MRAAAGVALAALLLLAGPAACTAGPAVPPVPPSHTPAVGPRWEPVALSPGVAPIRLAAQGDRLLVGGQRVTDSAPTLDLVDSSVDSSVDHGSPAHLRVAPDPASPYAAVARWQSMALAAGRLTAIGGAPGGAHANTRWTVWDADFGTDWRRAVLTERPQNFWTFGGWEAGGLVDAVATADGPLLVGAWNGIVGLDIAIYHRRGLRWERAESAGTPLASTRTDLVGAAAAAPMEAGVIIVGSVTHLGGGVRRAPAAWRSARGGSRWQRLALPQGDSAGSARSVSCAPSGCVVAGDVDGRYALWWVPVDGAPSRVGGVPELTVDEHTPMPGPVVRGERLWGFAGTTVLVRDRGRWAVFPAPDASQGADGSSDQGTATLLAAAATDSEVFVVVGDPAGPAGSRLWRTGWTETMGTP